MARWNETRDVLTVVVVVVDNDDHNCVVVY
jgi:hypothetical protein